MNEQISKLYKEATGKDWAYDFDPDIAERFAELIVKECIRVPYDMWDKAQLNADIAIKIDLRIKDHFGIEQ